MNSKLFVYLEITIKGILKPICAAMLAIAAPLLLSFFFLKRAIWWIINFK